ncbi:alpha/beta hydrolase [Pararhizobium arenae]|uniref:alpha/beta hydrolase n=1 Tax=Pararhizobium arenae TaxID=1856850 RepID=UPI000A742DBF|nr:prolyl oligopeptidase family serine peptidase [Pararhizobium arenae]
MNSSLPAIVGLVFSVLVTPMAAATVKASVAPPISLLASRGKTQNVESADTAQALAGESNVLAPTVPRPDRLVIFFHGIRGKGSVMESIGRSWKSTLPNTKFVSPDAPFPHQSGGRQWFAVDDEAMRPDRIEAARQAFDDLVLQIVEREEFENDLEDVAFVGVSQGAIMALDAVASGRWKVGALVSFAGLLPLPPTTDFPKTAILLMHGAADRTIPSAASVAASGQLKSAGYDVLLKVFPAVGHTISSNEASEAAIFLRDKLYR